MGQKPTALMATAIRDRNSNPLDWWKGNASHFPHVAKLAGDVLAVQASSVASESTFSTAGHVRGKRTTLSDESIISCLLLRSWQRQLGV